MRGQDVAILALDPGPLETGYCRFFAGRVVESGTLDNREMRRMVRSRQAEYLALEMIASYGMPVGRDVFETCLWIGRFIEVHGGKHELVYRKDVKMHLCGTPRAKDANIRQALIDLIGPPGKKASPGPTYGVKGHAWAALAVAVTAAGYPDRPYA